MKLKGKHRWIHLSIAIFARFNVVLLLRGIFTAVKANKDQVEPDVLQGQS